MAKLYYTPTSCGASNFIAAYVAGFNLNVEQVDVRAHTCSTGDYYKINPKGNVPAIVLDDGTLLNENSATLQYIADNAKTTKVGAPAGTSQRYLLQSALSYVSSELHASVGGLFNPTISDDVKTYLKARVATKLDYIEKELVGSKKFVVGDSFTIVDSYLYIVLTWFPYLQIDLTPYPNITAFKQRISEIPEVKAAHARMAENPSTVL